MQSDLTSEEMEGETKRNDIGTISQLCGVMGEYLEPEVAS